MPEASPKRSIGLKAKFFSVVFIFVIICILIGAVGLWNLSEMKNQIRNIVDNSAEKIMLATATKNDLLVIAVSEKNMLISEKESEMTAYADIIAGAESAIKEQTQAMIPLAAKSEQKLLEDFNQAFSSFMTVNAQVTELTLQNTNFKAARLSATEGMPLVKELDLHVENILQQYETEFNEATKLFDAMYLAEVGELMQRSARLLGMVKSLQTTVQAIILSRDPREIENLVQQLSELTTPIQAEFDDLESKINDKSRSDFNAAKDLFASFTKTIGRITQLALQNSNEKAFALSMTEGKKYLDQAEDLMSQMVEHSRKGLKADREASDSNFRQALSLLAGIAAAGILVGIILASIIIRQLMTVLNKSFSFARTLSSGDFTSRLDIRRNDELGDLARHLNDIALNVGELIKGLLQKIESLTQASRQLASLSGGMTSHASDASKKSRSAAQAAKEMDDSMSSVAAGMAETSTNLSTVAAAAEEMTATINEVSTNTAKARQTTDEAVTQTREAKARVEHLNKAAAAIDKVTETITDISEQTNLLALNATIEAARAGEAGKGFSIVASEIKDLAGQTAKATEEIKKEIQQIQDETADTVSLITKVDSIIFNINELTESIATAIEEQSATTREISSNINHASDAGHSISGNITQSSTVTRQVASDVSDISTMSDSISENSTKVSSSADELAQIASTLREMASKFKV